MSLHQSDRHASLTDAARAARYAAGMSAPEDSDTYARAKADYDAKSRALYLYESERAKEAAAAAHATKLAQLKARAGTGVELAHEAKRAAQDKLDKARTQRARAQANLDAVEQRYAQAKAEHAAARKAQVDAIASGAEPTPVAELPEFPAAIARLREPIAVCDASITAAEQAIAAADTSIACAVNNKANAEIHAKVSELRHLVLVAKQSAHVARVGGVHPEDEWAQHMRVSFGDGGVKVWIADPSLSDSDVLADELLCAYAAAAKSPEADSHG